MNADNDEHNRPSVLECLSEMEGNLNFMATQILSASLPGTLHNLFANSAIYSSKQSRRIRNSYEAGPTEEIEAIAWSTRCLLETRLMLHHVMRKKHDEAMATINDELTRDDNEITIGLLFSDDDQAVKSQLQATMKSLPKTPNNSDLADRSDFATEYRTYYKFLCKYTHPSMYLLFGAPALVRKIEIVDLMVDRAAGYMAEICDAIAYAVDHLP